MAHRPPRDTDHPDRILHDDCADCEQRAKNFGLGLDAVNFTRMWDKMIAVEYRREGAYTGENEATLGRDLYFVSLLLQRYPDSLKPFRVETVYQP